MSREQGPREAGMRPAAKPQTRHPWRAALASCPSANCRQPPTMGAMVLHFIAEAAA
jgi:hypothetical protein